MTTTTPEQQLTEAEANFAAWREESEAATAAADLAEQATPATPSKAAEIAQNRLVARERVQVAAAACSAAAEKVQQARRALVAAHADEMAPAIAELQHQIDAHTTKVERQLTALRNLTGLPFPRPTYIPTQSAWTRERDQLTRQQQALRDAAQGIEPALRTEELPADLRIDGVLPCAAALQQAEREREEAEFEAQAARCRAQLDEAVQVFGADIIGEIFPDGLELGQGNDREFVDALMVRFMTRIGQYRVTAPGLREVFTAEQSKALETILELIYQLPAATLMERLTARELAKHPLH